MADEIEQPQEPEQQSIEALRQANIEINAKAKKRSERIVELEAKLSEYEADKAKLTDTIHQMTIEAPMKAMAESISAVPDVFLEHFSKLYKVEQTDGKLTLLSIEDGKPVIGPDGKTVPFEREDIFKLLTDSAHPHAGLYSRILIASRASGGNSSSQSESRPKPKPSVQFGLR